VLLLALTTMPLFANMHLVVPYPDNAVPEFTKDDLCALVVIRVRGDRELRYIISPNQSRNSSGAHNIASTQIADQHPEASLVFVGMQ
jgi:hypothetical protein